MPSVFVSYSTKNSSFARQLATSLSSLGIDVWMDVDDIPPGMRWSTAIQRGLDVSDLMIVVITPQSMVSRHVEDEWQYALDHGIPVIPVLWQPADVHFQLNRLQYIDFHEHDFDDALPHLQNAIDIKIAAPDSPFRVPGKRQIWPTPTYQYPRWTRYLQYASYGLVTVIIVGAIIYYNVLPGGGQSTGLNTPFARSMTLPRTEAVRVYPNPIRQGDPISLDAATFTLRIMPRGELWYMVESNDDSVTGSAYVPADTLANDAVLYALPLSVILPGQGLQIYDAPDASSPSITELGVPMLVYVHGFWRAETGEMWYRASKPNGSRHGWLFSADGLYVPVLAGYATATEALTLWPEPAAGGTSETLPAGAAVRVLTATTDYYQVLVLLDNDWRIRYIERADLPLPGLMQQDLEDRALA